MNWYESIRIYDSDEIIVDYCYDNGKQMLRISQFEDYHFKDEHFCEIPGIMINVKKVAEILYDAFGDPYPGNGIDSDTWISYVDPLECWEDFVRRWKGEKNDNVDLQ